MTQKTMLASRSVVLASDHPAIQVTLSSTPVVLPLGYTDSITSLAISATFTGTARAATLLTGHNFFNANVYADQAGTLYIDQSLDSGSTYQAIDSVAITNGGKLSVPVTGAQTSATLYRVRFVNGATAQGVFRLSTSFTVS